MRPGGCGNANGPTSGYGTLTGTGNADATHSQPAEDALDFADRMHYERGLGFLTGAAHRKMQMQENAEGS